MFWPVVQMGDSVCDDAEQYLAFNGPNNRSGP